MPKYKFVDPYMDDRTVPIQVIPADTVIEMTEEAWRRHPHRARLAKLAKPPTPAPVGPEAAAPEPLPLMPAVEKAESGKAKKSKKAQ